MEERSERKETVGRTIFWFIFGFLVASAAFLTALRAFPARFGYEEIAQAQTLPESKVETPPETRLEALSKEETPPETGLEAPSETQAETALDETAVFRESLWRAIARFQDGGGYDTALSRSRGFSQSVWDALDGAFFVRADGRPALNLSKARPSFCSSACYMALMAALEDWDETGDRIPPEAWRNLKPYVLHDGGEWPFQYDGIGCWGRANANGPGFALLASLLGAGVSGYIGGRGEYADDKEGRTAYESAWSETEPGDFLKLFWNAVIGSDSAEGLSESGHLVILLKRVPLWDEEGNRNDRLYYWSSNGSGTDINGGYGIGSCRIADVRRAVWTRITEPGAFRNAANVAPDDTDAWLSALDKHHTASAREMKAALAGEDMEAWLE